jgi:membrane associated rhomboid family serine protease
MKTKQFLVATLLAFLASNILTTVYYMIMDEANYVSFRREQMDFGLMILNHLFYAILMVYFYPFYFAKKSTGKDAFVFGALIAAIMFIPSALVIRSIWTVDVNPTFFLNTTAHLVIGGIMGLLIFLVSKKQLSQS